MIDLELREKVARLLGWTRHEDGTLTEPEENNEGYTPDELPPFEEDISAAWLVVEFMRGKGYVLKLLDQRDHPTDPRWRADFRLDFTHDDGEAFWQGLAPTAPLAICMAFVAAMENNHES